MTVFVYHAVQSVCNFNHALIWDLNQWFPEDEAEPSHVYSLSIKQVAWIEPLQANYLMSRWNVLVLHPVATLIAPLLIDYQLPTITSHSDSIEEMATHAHTDVPDG